MLLRLAEEGIYDMLRQAIPYIADAVVLQPSLKRCVLLCGVVDDLACFERNDEGINTEDIGRQLICPVREIGESAGHAANIVIVCDNHKFVNRPTLVIIFDN